jgi:hypothetical protein
MNEVSTEFYSFTRKFVVGPMPGSSKCSGTIGQSVRF